jgi:hypothetical protein
LRRGNGPPDGSRHAGSEESSTPHLIALKALAGRSQDLTDLGYLVSAAAPTSSMLPVTPSNSDKNAGSTGSRMSSLT